MLIGRDQAQALADLLWDGEHNGAARPVPEPPRRVALTAIGPLSGPTVELASYRDGAYVVDARGQVPIVDAPRVHNVVVAADDGRRWEITPAGCCWAIAPVGHHELGGESR